IAAVRRNRTKPRQCPKDQTRMVLLDEQWDDNHLQHGQLTEEQLGSVDYDVWQCQSCKTVTIEGYRKWFTRYGACRECGFRTVEGTEHVVRSATTSSEGLAEVDYHCMNCDTRYTVSRTISRRSESSSSSSHSSFGGGSSSGGGASGRW
ncbi:MAG: TPM domain-containing protein, partial [Deltaproteobacteria bacterium]